MAEVAAREADAVHYEPVATYTIAARQPACGIVSPKWVTLKATQVTCRKCLLVMEHQLNFRITRPNPLPSPWVQIAPGSYSSGTHDYLTVSDLTFKPF